MHQAKLGFISSSQNLGVAKKKKSIVTKTILTLLAG
jgi:hypothetical protein